jgi:hypothetical protein
VEGFFGRALAVGGTRWNALCSGVLWGEDWGGLHELVRIESWD